MNYKILCILSLYNNIFFGKQPSIQDCLDAFKSNADRLDLQKISKTLLSRYCRKVKIALKSTQPIESAAINIVEKVIDKVVLRISNGEQITEHSLTTIVYSALDGLLLPMVISLDNKQRISAEQIYLRWFEQYHSHPDFTKLLLSDDDRYDAFTMAFSKCLAKVRKNEFKEQSSLFTYFFRILYGECVDAVRKKLKTPGAVLLDSLDEDVKEMINVHPPSISKRDLERLMKLLPYCFELFKLKSEGFKYEELAAKFHKALKDIKYDIEKCRDRLQKAIGTS